MEKKIMIITGICGNIGSYIGKYFFDSGKWTIIGIDKKINKKETDIIYKKCDISVFPHVDNLMDNIITEFGIPEVLINCAGMIFNMPIISFSEGQIKCHDYKDWEIVISSNLTSAFYMSVCFVKYLFSKRKNGLIINVSSICSKGNQGQAAYSAAKAGLNGLTKAMGKELGPFGIRVVGLSPGFFETDTTKQNLSSSRLKNITASIPLKRLGTLDEIAGALDFIIKNDYINAKVLELDGGLVI